MFIFFVSTWSGKILSQTYIGPVLGYDFQKVISTRDFIRLDLKNKGFGNGSPLIGIKLKQILINQFYLQISADFTHKHVRGFPDGGFFQDFLYHYNYYKNQFLFTYYWKKKWKIGGGITYNIVNKLYYEDLERGHMSNNKVNYTEKGWVFLLGLKYNKFEFEVYYNNRIETPISGENIYGFHLHQIQSLGLRVSYDFKIFDACKKKEKPELLPVNKMAIVE
ncbi:MAG: hypothetical protein IPM92_00320 [Saprospiraceae bacterium]|nr:hypothetical protein [Saprospiraceae bacterium]